MQQDFASETTAIQPALVVSVVYTIGLVKEVQIVYRLFLVLHVPTLLCEPSIDSIAQIFGFFFYSH